jgi:glycosyltransferase involved in cell wall biosynthesis
MVSQTKMSVPLVSVIIPLYESQGTLGRCLVALKSQTFRDFEVILVDSSPHDKAHPVAQSVMPNAEYVHVERRLLPQAARNVGAERARGDLYAFTDPDVYPAPGWLEYLVGAWRAGHPVVLGCIACHGRRWLDRGIHFCKFNICLPGGEARSVPLGWSGNLLVGRRLFEALGGWDPEHVQGDSVFSARVRAAGHELWFEPRAVVEHDHEGVGFRGFVTERYRRGLEFASLELSGRLEPGEPAGASVSRRSLRQLLLSPLLVPRRVIRIGRVAAKARLGLEYCSTLPVVLSGVSAWYAGMWVCHWERRAYRRDG